MKDKLKKFAKISNYKILALCVLVIIAVIYYYEDYREVEVHIPTKEVVVLKDDVPENTVIDRDMLVLEQRYEEDILKQSNIAISFDDVVGKRTLVPLYKGEIIKKDRLIINEEYMNNKTIKTEISFQLNEIDKALNLQKGDYIDIWIEPIDREMLPQKLFSKLRIKEVINVNKELIEEDKEYTENEEKIASFIILELTDLEIENLYNIDKKNNNIRIARYADEYFYNIVNQVIKEKTMVEEVGDLVEEKGN